MLSVIALWTLTASVPSPPIVCDVSMKNWCIVQLPSTVGMTDEENTRKWTVKTNQDVATAEISIIEDKFCDGPLKPVLLSGSDPGTFFIKSSQGCGLQIIVSTHDADVKPGALAKNIIMLRSGNRWLSLGF
jgi:hypothetical protein